MKNLKKVLLALVVVAMLVSSIVTIAIANDSQPAYTGSVEEAQKLYDAVLADNIKNDLAKQSTALVAFYAYVDANPIDPAAEGYAALIDAYNLKTYTVAEGLYSAYLKDMSADKLAAVFTHVAAAPSLDGTVEIEEVKYSDFVKKVNFASVERADALADVLFAKVADGNASYYEYLALQQAFAKFLDEVKTLGYTELNPNPELYTGNVVAAQALLKKVKDDAKLSELMSGLAEVYTYLRTTPVNPATDEFADFFASYNAKCDALAAAFSAELDGAKTVEEQIAILKTMRAYLTATPLSENVVKAFNDKRADVVAKYNTFKDNFGVGKKLAAELENIQDIPLISSLTDLAALITTLEGIEQPYTVEKKDAFAAVYNYLAENEIAPETEGYAELIAKYNAEVDVIVTYLAKSITATANIKEKYDGLKSYGEFLADYPVSEAAIAEYNTLKAELVELLNSFSDALNQLVLPTYTPKAAPSASTNVGILNYMLDCIENADGETSEAKLEAQKAAMSAMYKYLLAVEINTEEEGYADFVEAYNAERAELTTALLATIDAAEAADAKDAAFQAVKAYLVETPYSYDAVVAFNDKVATVYAAEADKATRERLTIGTEYNIYFAIDEIFEFFKDEHGDVVIDDEASIDEVLANVEAVYAYSLCNYDVTDSKYAKFVSMCNDIFTKVGNYLVDYAERGAMNTDIEKVSLVCEFFKKVPFSEVAINSFNDMITHEDNPETTDEDESGRIQEFVYWADTVVEQFPKPSYIYNKLNTLVDDFNKAEGLDDRIEAFKALYDAKAEVEDKHLTSVQAGDAAFRAAYDEICNKMAAEIVASVVADTETAPSVQVNAFEKAYDFLKDYKFSKAAVEGYNKKLQAVNAVDFAAVITKINTECPALVYTSPEATESNFTALKGYINAAANSDEELVKAYKYFGGDYKNAKAFDFAKADFTALIATFTGAKAAATARYSGAIDAAELNAKPAALDAMYKFIMKNCVSSSMVNAYIAKCADVEDAYIAEFNKVFAPYTKAVEAIHTLLSKCEPNLALLTEAELAVYNDMQLKLDAFECAEVYGKILAYKTTKGEGDYLFIIQNQMADALTAYYRSYEVTESYSEYAFANYLFAQAAEDFISFYAETIEFMYGDDEVMKAAAVSELRAFIEDEMLCQVMADLFNATFAAGEDDEKIDYENVGSLPAEATGALTEFTALIKAYVDCQMRELGDGEEYTEADYDTCKESKREVLIELFTYLEENPLDPTPAAVALFEAVNATLDELNALTDAQKKEIDKTTPEYEYDLQDGRYQYDFEDGNLPDGITAHRTFTTEIAEETLADGTTNKYWLLHSGTSTWRGISLPTVSASLGTIFEFDVMLPAGKPIMDFDIRPQGKADGVSGTALMENKFMQGVFTRFEDYDPDHPEGLELKLTQGEWMHFVVFLNPVDYKMTLYVDYVEIGTVTLCHGGKPEQLITANALNILFGNKTQDVALDNIDCYAGTSFRLHDKFEGMSEGDRFKYYVDTFTNTEFEAKSRANAYNMAAEMVATYRGVAGYEAYVNAFDSFDYDTIYPAEEKKARLDALVEMMEASGAYNVNSDNYSGINTKLFEIENYIVKNSDYLDLLSDEYNGVKAAIANAYADVERVKQLLELIDALELFSKATTVSGMTRRLAEVAVVYEKCNFYDADNYDKANNDPAVKAYLAAFGEDITLGELYNEIIPNIIAERATYENAGKIVSYVEKLKGLVENADGLSEAAFLEALMTAATATENFDYANAYITVIRNIIKSDDYVKTYEGLDEAIKVFNYLDGHFYNVMIGDQIAEIEAQLDKYYLTDSYIDRLGICTYVRKYIDENEVDVEDSLIAPYYTMLLMFEDELKSYENQYKSILQYNTAAFIAIVERMSAFTEYKDIKALYDEALNNYYYNMNLDSEAAKAAMATFDAYAVIVNAAEENSKLFVEAAGKLAKATKTKAIYNALVECAAYVDGVDSSINGVAEALEVYNTKLSAYNAKINPVNTQIEDTANVVCSVRTVSVDATVLATVKKFINK